jgi:dynein heavy chain, axonemal
MRAVCLSSAPPHTRASPHRLLPTALSLSPLPIGPADLLSNLSRAWACFSDDRIAACAQPGVFKACLFALCFYHALVLGRRRFGQQGWSRKYSFNNGDLTVSGSRREPVACGRRTWLRGGLTR